jgi:hypothetical protein
MNNEAEEKFLTRWRKRLEVHLEDFQGFIATTGVLGTVAASIAILASDLTLSAGVITGLAGNFVSNAVERWRNAEDDQRREEVLQQILDEVRANRADESFRTLAIKLNLAKTVSKSLSIPVEELDELARKGFATSKQVTKINTGGGHYIAGDVNAGRDFVGGNIIHHNYGSGSTRDVSEDPD